MSECVDSVHGADTNNEIKECSKNKDVVDCAIIDEKGDAPCKKDCKETEKKTCEKEKDGNEEDIAVSQQNVSNKRKSVEEGKDEASEEIKKAKKDDADDEGDKSPPDDVAEEEAGEDAEKNSADEDPVS